jgi:hypothetical protein
MQALTRARAWVGQNGLEGCELEVSKARQYACLQAAGVLVPTTRVVVGGPSALAAVAATFTYPVVVKPNCGGRGDGVVLVETAEALRTHAATLAAPTTDASARSPDGVLLVQQYIAAPQPRILRVELVGGRLVYAMDTSTTDGFRLCAADACNVAPPAPTTTGAAAAKYTYRPDIGPDHPLVRQYAAFMAAHGVDMAGFESIEDSEGRRYTYDVNVSTNYAATVELAAGVDGCGHVVDLCLARFAQAYGPAAARL